jgi:hypothetical protein
VPGRSDEALTASMVAALAAPDPTDLWRLRGDLLERGVAPDAPVMSVVEEFHSFLDRLATGTTSRGYSDLASWMDIGSLGGVVAEDLFEAEGAEALARRVLAGLVTEGLAVLATRQHVKAWETELASVRREAAWFLYGALWRFAARRNPDLALAERRALLERLLAPLADPSLGGAQKAIVAGRLFQVLLVDGLAEALETVGQRVRT